jgi:hypothetical protein
MPEYHIRMMIDPGTVRVRFGPVRSTNLAELSVATRPDHFHDTAGQQA